MIMRFWQGSDVPYQKTVSCRVENHIPSLDLVGIFVLVGSSASVAGIPYTYIVRSRMPYLNAYVTSGTLGLAYAVVTCIEWWPARVLTGAGESRSMLELIRLKVSSRNTYVGLRSGTSLPVRGAVGEALVFELVTQGRKRADAQTKVGRDSARPTYVIWANIGESVNGEVAVSDERGALLNVVAIVVCALVLLLDAQYHEWLSLLMVGTGMFFNAALGVLLRLRNYEFIRTKAAQDSPPGDSLILLNDEPDTLCVLRGSEDAIQRLLQRELIETGFTKPLPLFMVCVAMMTYSAVVILVVPLMGVIGQLLLLIAIFFGAMVDLLKGSWDGKRAIAKEAIGKYGIQIVGVKKFGNRTAAVASVAAGSSKTDALQRSGVLPATGLVWERWWGALNTLVQEAGEQDRSTLAALVESKHSSPLIDPLWTTLRNDMLDGYTET
uniref:Uncharacterized protein n=1 Tax=Physcomitrium patens TaxID=3218 RepID=A0A7I3Z7W9_PHYPA